VSSSSISTTLSTFFGYCKAIVPSCPTKAASQECDKSFVLRFNFKTRNDDSILICLGGTLGATMISVRSMATGPELPTK
jgi:hypothetical protein